MKIIVLGSGNIGSIIAKDLAESLPSSKITIADFDEARAKESASNIGRANVSWVQVDATDHKGLVNALKAYDVAVGALPGSMGYQACKAAIAAKVNMVDVSYMPEDIMTMHKDALKAGICVVPDCGMSPGLSNVLIGQAVSRLDKVERVCLLNGGLPEKPVPPLGYVVTWSVKDLIDMYTRKVTIVQGGKATTVEPLTGLEHVSFPGTGKLEAFYTDGLRTLLHTVTNVEEMWEKTLRYPGHVEKIKLLKTLGYFDEKAITVNDCTISPRELTGTLFQKHLRKSKVKDIVLIRIHVTGLKKGRRTTLTFELFDRYDEKRKVTAMARSTAYTASIVTQLLAQGAIEERGIVPPEKLGADRNLYGKFIEALKARNFIIKEEFN